MKLYLSSYKIPSLPDLRRLLDPTKSTTHVALIPNAKDYYAPRARTFKIEQAAEYVRSLGFTPSIIDLHDYQSAFILKSLLSHYHIIWVMGGNTFCLRQAMKESGFDTIIASLLEGNSIYVGESAGAVVAGTSLRGIEADDPPEFCDNPIDSGLSLIPYVVLPHVGNTQFSQSTETTRTLHAGQPMIEITDNQAVVWQDTTYTIIDSQDSVDQ
ncbi:MAG: hypothetical protein NVSMB46_01730 [Candidatus Saccharimonadales bacterium]